MERIVKLFAQETQRKVTQLRLCAMSIAGAVIALLLGLGWFVIRPATRTIRSQVDQLESRVDQRTSETVDSQSSAAVRNVRASTGNRSKTNNWRHNWPMRRRLSAMGHLTASLAHEINQPLGAIANYAEICDLELSQTSPSTSGKVAATHRSASSRLPYGLAKLCAEFATLPVQIRWSKWTRSMSMC